MRPEEAEIPLEYLKMIHEKHEKWFQEYDKEKVLIIDTDNDFKHNENLIDQMMQKLKDFIHPKEKDLGKEK